MFGLTSPHAAVRDLHSPSVVANAAVSTARTVGCDIVVVVVFKFGMRKVFKVADVAADEGNAGDCFRGVCNFGDCCAIMGFLLKSYNVFTHVSVATSAVVVVIVVVVFVISVSGRIWSTVFVVLTETIACIKIMMATVTVAAVVVFVVL